MAAGFRYLKNKQINKNKNKKNKNVNIDE